MLTSRTSRALVAAVALTGTLAGGTALYARGPAEGHPNDEALATVFSQTDRSTAWQLA